MKKLISISLIIIVSLYYINVAANKIPEEAIRIRVVANSDSEYDQQVKEKVSTLLKKEMYYLLKDTDDVEQARKIINENLENIDNNIYSLLKKENYNLGYKINFGKNFFPEKTYKGITYEEGYYESLLVTLGSGEGQNWWCILFPPLCLIEAEESEEVEYKCFIQELFEKIFIK